MADPSPDWPRHAARLTSRDAGRPLVVVTLELPDTVRASHTVPGQYVSIVTAGENGYFVLASPVGAEAWRLLAKGGGTVADALLAAPLGTTFPVTAALGRGFPCDEAHGRPLVFVAAGTGIAAAAPIAARRIADGDALQTRMFLGVQHTSDLPFAEDLAAWRATGMDVVLCVSRDEIDDATGREAGFIARGYVQDVARARVSPAEGTMIFAVGPAPMVEATRALAPLLGATEFDVRTNY